MHILLSSFGAFFLVVCEGACESFGGLDALIMGLLFRLKS